MFSVNPLNNRSLKLYLNFLAFTFLIFGCDVFDDDNHRIRPDIPFLSLIELDTLWAKHSGQIRRITVAVSPAAAALNAVMTCQITSPGGATTHFRLLDDGGSQKPRDALGFADTLSGDRIAGDGMFSRRISAKFAQLVGIYKFTFDLMTDVAVTPQMLEVSVRVLENTPPQIVRFLAPDEINREFFVIVQDSNGSADIALVNLVRLEAYARPEAVYPMTRSNDSAWYWIQPRGYGAGLRTGNYPWSVRVADWTMRQSNQFVQSDSIEVHFTNGPPSIRSVTGPDTVWVSANETVVFYYLVKVDDVNSAFDLDSLLLTIRDPEREVAHFVYFDDGGLPDASLDSIAGDGVFTAGFSADSTSRTGVLFTFTWLPTDRSPQRGLIYSNNLVILRRVSAPDRTKTEAAFHSKYTKIDW
ncbi:MAG: hypothetical protein FJY65_11315 [Calditrichaeota bacterium]|nr:hypothetical protein [Calditrichota bacterium]